MAAQWICKQGHTWQSVQNSEPRPSLCPFCGSGDITSSASEPSGSFDETLNRPSGTHRVEKPPATDDNPLLYETLQKPSIDSPSSSSGVEAQNSEIPCDLHASTLARPAQPAELQTPISTAPHGQESALFEETMQKPAGSLSPPAQPVTAYPAEFDTATPPFAETLRKPADSRDKETKVAPGGATPVHDEGEAEATFRKEMVPVTPLLRSQPRQPIVAGYEILGTLGRGGMGVVYKARQTRLNRMAALKMMLGGAHASRQDLVRFQIEAEAIARLQHPNIVQLFEAGDQDGLPFFALEFVEGGTLQERLVREPLSYRESAQILEVLARAMFYAHQKGIIHRDLKPSNILLNADGMPKITDFGLAKQMDANQGQTGSGDILGTPNYMAPEQAEGRNNDIGTGTDIFALGAIFYDMLTGQPPFRGTTVMDTLHQVMFGEPVPPVQLRPDVPRDLQVICLKCLEKDIQKRYHTAEALADDLRRYLSGQPIQARPASLWERGWKWARRRPAAAALAVVSVLATLLLLGGGIAFAHREYTLHHIMHENWEYALKQEARAKTEHKKAEEQRQLAEEHFQLARLAVEKMHTRVAEEKLVNQPRMSKVRQELLENARDFYEKFLTYRGEDEGLRWETVRAYQNVGNIQEQLGQYEEAEQAYQSGLTLLAGLHKEKPANAEYRLAEGRILSALGVVQQVRKEMDRAEKSLQQAVQVLMEVEKHDAQDGRCAYELARAYNAWAVFLLVERKEEAQAEQAFREALTRLVGLEKERPEVEYHAQLAQASGNLSALLKETQPLEAVSLSDHTLKAYLFLNKRFPDFPDYRMEVGKTYLNLAELSKTNAAHAKTVTLFGEAEKYLASLQSDYPEVVDYRYLLALLYKNRSVYYRDRGQPQFSEQDLGRAIPHWEELVNQTEESPVNSYQLAVSLGEHARYLRAANEIVRAEKELSRSVELLKTLKDRSPRDRQYPLELAKSYFERGNVYFQDNQYASARDDYSQAITLVEELAKSEKPLPQDQWDLLVNLHGNTANLLEADKKPKDALAHLQRAETLLRDRIEANQKDAQIQSILATCLARMGSMALQLGDAKEGWKYLEDAVVSQRQFFDTVKTDAAREQLAEYALSLFDTLLAQKDHAALARKLAELAADFPKQADYRVEWAAALSQCVLLVREEKGLAMSKRDELAETYGSKAVGYLEEAVRMGYTNSDVLKEAVFEPVRERKDFQQLEKEVKSKK
jgi:tetratricopeptide (TPR) repeat protein/tRNA A-37 threonylcarbamoyl transferase component Bud32